MTDDATLFWLIGLLEGEGSFLRPSPSKPREPKIDLEMKDEAVIKKVAALFGVAYRSRDRKRANTSVTYHVRLAGKRAVQLMWRIKPYLCPRRQAQIDRAIQCYLDRGIAYHPGNMPPFELRPVCAEPLCPAPQHLGSRYCVQHLGEKLVTLVKAA